MRVIILSKNRAAQADLLLRSIKEQVRGWEDFFITIFYDYDGGRYDQGYALLKSIHPEFHYYRKAPGQEVINGQFNDLIAMKKMDFFAFFADDLVVIRPFSKSNRPFQILQHRKDVMALALRLNPNINYCQPMGMKTFPPRLDADGVFTWRKTNFGYFLEKNIISRSLQNKGLKVFMPILGDWYYQMILDGNVYRYDEFKDYFATLPEMKYVPDIERVMLARPLPARKAVIYPESRVISIASNKVDKKYFTNPHMEEDPAIINEHFLNGESLSYDHLKNINHTACHLKIPLHWARGSVATEAGTR